MTQQAQNTVTAPPCRSVTDEEIDHYQEYGWVKLKSFVDPDVLRSMLALAKEKMGEDGDSNPSPGKDEAAGMTLEYFNSQHGAGLSHPLIRPLLHEAGKSAKRLMQRGGDVGVRYYSDIFVPKLPASRETRHGGNGPTAFHQDFITFSVDRSGGMTMWFPLEAYGPDSGTMSFVNGSHRLGVMGDYTTYGDGDALTAFPELQDREMSEVMTYELGDISVHTHLTIHGAGKNVTDRPRWAYILVTAPEDACWNGSPCPNFDTSDMQPWQPLDDERFPVIS